MTNRIRRGFNRAGVFLAAAIAVIGGLSAVLVYQGGGSVGPAEGALLVVTIVSMVGAWAFCVGLGWVISGFARD